MRCNQRMKAFCKKGHSICSRWIVKLYFLKWVVNSVTAMASSTKMTPLKGKDGKWEWSVSWERPREELDDLVPVETNELALLLRVQRRGGWKLEGIAPEAFNGQVIQRTVKQVTGIEPLSLDIVNKVDAILELPNDALVTQVGQELQCVIEWGGYDVDISSLMARRPIILDVARTQTEMVEWLWHQEEDAVRLQENVQQDHQLLTALLNHVDEQSRLVDAVWERQESVPRISSSIATPSVQMMAPRKKSKPPTLPIFSGEIPTPRGEAEYQQWIFQVHSFRESYTDEAIKNAIIANCRGCANAVVRANGFDTDLNNLIERLDSQFGIGQAGDEILREFHQMIQGPKESVQDFGAKLECVFRTINERFPGWYALIQLKTRFFTE